METRECLSLVSCQPSWEQCLEREERRCKGRVYIYDNPRSKNRQAVAQRQCKRILLNEPTATFVQEWCVCHINQAPKHIKKLYQLKWGCTFHQCRGLTQKGKGPQCRVIVACTIKGNDVWCHHHRAQAQWKQANYFHSPNINWLKQKVKVFTLPLSSLVGVNKVDETKTPTPTVIDNRPPNQKKQT